MKTKTFFIVTNNLQSKFAKNIQQALKEISGWNVLRTSKQKTRNAFYVTPNPLNKIEQLQRFKTKDINHPAFATSVEAAKQLNSRTLFARTLINSTNGRGILEFEHSAEVYPTAPLYTGYIPKKAEYRIHVFNGKVIDVQQKKIKTTNANTAVNHRVRNLDNGYVYCRNGVTIPNHAHNLAISAVQALDYQYGAVDVIYNEKQDKYFVLEVNSKPGLQGQTLVSYAKAIYGS